MILNITDSPAEIQKAKTLLKQGKPAEARAVLRYLARLHPESIEVWLLSEQASIKPEEKMYCLVQALRIDPESVEAHARMSALQEQAALETPIPEAQARQAQPSPIQPVAVGIPPLPAREVLEPVVSPLERSARQSVSAPARLLPVQAAQGSMMAAHPASASTLKPKPKFRWWFILFIIIGFTLIGISLKYDYVYDRFERWQMKTYGVILEENWHENSDYRKRLREYENSASNMNALFLIGAGKTLGAMSLGVWFIDGVVGGFMLAIKKLRGSDWAWLLVLLPVVLFPAYLALSGFLGEVMYAIGKHSGYSKKRCLQCKGWIPISAMRCQHCGQAIEVS